MVRRTLRKVGGSYRWFIRKTPYGSRSFKSKAAARAYLMNVDQINAKRGF